VWLAIDLGIVGLGLVLVVIVALSAWRRWKKLSRTGSRFGDRMARVGELAGSLADRLQESDRLPDRRG
jgi:hypothetical protein